MFILRVAVLISVAATVVLAVHRYVWVRLARDPMLPTWLQRAVGVALVLLVVAIVLTMLFVRRGDRGVVAPLAWVTYTWMGVLFFLVFAFLVGELLRYLAPTPLDASKRVLVARVFAALAATVAVAAAAKGFANVRGGPAWVRVPVRLARLRGNRVWRLAQLTDVHVGPTIGREFIEKIVDRVNAERPDLVVITGDLVDGTVASLAEHVAPLRRLVAPHGVYFVTGNHEYFSGAAAWCAHLETLGIHVLRNRCVAVGGEDGFTLAGVDDWTARDFASFAPGHGHDLAAALAASPEGRAVVLLAHQPKSIREATARGVDLQLSGHTHGGQLFPFNFLVQLQQPYVAGLTRVTDRTQIYVSRGTGYWGPPMRLGAPAEMTLLTLEPGGTASPSA